MIDANKYAIKCFQDEAKAILDMIPNLTDDFSKAVDLIYNCKGRFVITGVGKSGHIGAKIAATLASTGTPTFFVNPLDAYHGDLGVFTPDDVVMAISYSGQTDELLRFIPLLLDRNIPIIGVSGNPNSLLAQYSVCHLNVYVDREADALNLAPTSSTTATLAMGDALACALEKVRHFKAADFAQFHPGGSLGRRLLSRVKDFMVSTNLPIVHPDQKISDTIIEISKTKQGIAVALDNNKIAGVVTDGDVRRAMYDKQDRFFDLTVKEIMSTNPKTISENAKLSLAGEMMREYNIHSLIVVDDNFRFVGVIDSFSCL
ncbi:sugar isomerase KpsF/GutQ family [Bacteroides intestinalis CAG:315]|jgi:arabinose-5-phosphate isomerase|uniref:KpsF/GutQ family sugar-phosphate isomerase n=1 Tax=Bacteroides intestinalis TaxID=329854 RepID=A0A412XU41_9BACE|nr:KpsF/GutQ family sugar-phosphate isomerase [Bacteroides intestinalis]RGV48589.1 KpsF/GutQ family sugar-phosphate isomerase [Bacteroides intestinalis]RHA60917.1 KpsF/GutQ family sugar-phosphate isomerase [Bacteroides intestinalis]CDD97627.1 sugar isomerase KpsF/GutQ family [Bacteroides intestinalis CAG:315]